MLKYLIWFMYIASLWWLFLTTMEQDVTEKKTEPHQKTNGLLVIIMAFLPPLANTLAILGYLLYPENTTLAKWFIVFWGLGWASIVYELLDLGKPEIRKLGWSGRFAGVFLLGILFGPGMFIGYVWIFC